VNLQNNKKSEKKYHEELPEDHGDTLIQFLHKTSGQQQKYWLF